MEAVIAILTPATFIAMLILERVFPGRPLPKVRRWALKGITFFVLGAIVGGIAPAVLANVLGPRAPVHLDGIPVLAAAAIAFLAGDLLFFGVHRAMHVVPFLWRWTHQMHHSAERVDMWGASFLHPLDLLVQVGASTVPVLVLGLRPDAAALAGYIGFVWSMFQHLNVRTPRWLGWFMQRPEAHAVHHARGVHAYNYGTFPLWDILSGTFRSPARFTGPAGFWDGSSEKVGAMLAGRDVSAAPAPESEPMRRDPIRIAVT